MGAVAFAGMGTFGNALGGTCPWPVIALTRATIPMLITGCLVAAARVPVPWFHPTMWMRSIAGSISLLCTFYCLTKLSVSDVLTLTNLYPLWVAVLSWPLLRHKPANSVWISCVVGIGGVALIQKAQIGEHSSASLIAIFSSFSSSFALIGLHRLHGVDSRAIVFHFSLVAVLLSLGAILLVHPVLPSTVLRSPNTVSLLVGCGLSATVGQFCLTKAFILGNPARVSVVGLSQVGFAMLFDIVLWGRTFDTVKLVGIGLVVLSSGWVMLSSGQQTTDGQADDVL